jgi:predicted transposase/invertase (TIGR01784 family)
MSNLTNSTPHHRQLITFDWAIKTILRNKANFGILEGFLSELLYTQIHIQSILESESNQDYRQDKYTRVDLKVNDDAGKIYLIELQYDHEIDYFQRMLFNTSKATVEQLDLGDLYKDIQQIICINILYFNLGKGEDYIYKGTTNFIGVHNHDQLQLSAKQIQTFKSQQVNQLFPHYYLIQLKQFNEVLQDKFDQWIYFLKRGEILDHFDAQGLQEAQQKLDLLNMPEIERMAFDRYIDTLRQARSAVQTARGEGLVEGMQEGLEQGIEMGKEQGIEIGKEQGELKAKLETAKKLYGMGLTVAQIMQATDFTATQLAEIGIYNES